MKSNELEKVREFVKESNRSNSSVKFFLRIEDGVLLSIDVRFCSLRGQEIKSWTVANIFNHIEELSQHTVIPSGDMKLIKNGVLALEVSYMNKKCSSEDIIKPLKFIAGDFIDTLLGRKIVESAG